MTGHHAGTGAALEGYEIHLGRTTGSDCARPFASIAGVPDGAATTNGRIMGTYLHGCFASDGFRKAFLASLGAETGDVAFGALIDSTLDELAQHLERHVDLKRILALAAPVAP